MLMQSGIGTQMMVETVKEGTRTETGLCGSGHVTAVPQIDFCLQIVSGTLFCDGLGLRVLSVGYGVDGWCDRCAEGM